MAAKGKSTLSGAATGASIGSVVPGIGTAIGAGVGAAVGLVSSFFTSNKHYNLYYWETADSSWKFVMEGHPNQIKPVQKEYISSNIPTQVVRNKNGTAKTPTTPPAGYEKSTVLSTVNPIAIFSVIGLFLIILYLMYHRKKK